MTGFRHVMAVRIWTDRQTDSTEMSIMLSVTGSMGAWQEVPLKHFAHYNYVLGFAWVFASAAHKAAVYRTKWLRPRLTILSSCGPTQWWAWREEAPPSHTASELCNTGGQTLKLEFAHIATAGRKKKNEKKKNVSKPRESIQTNANKSNSFDYFQGPDIMHLHWHQ